MSLGEPTRSRPVEGAGALDRWSFLRAGIGLVAGAGLLEVACGNEAEIRRRVAIVRQADYDVAAVRASPSRAFDLLGGIEGLVKTKTVTVKVNLTGYAESLFGRPPGETYVTHPATALALAGLLKDLGAARVRFVESCGTLGTFQSFAGSFGRQASAFAPLGDVSFENTRNRGGGSGYSRVGVPGTPRLFSHFLLNHCYADGDVMISLAKMKTHLTAAGVTLSMKNMFGITPNALYGIEAGAKGEDATGYRGCLHNRAEGGVPTLPGELMGFEDRDAYFRVPRIIVDLVAARPIDLALIDGITTISGGEGPWNSPLAFLAPGVLIAGRDPVSTDAVGVRVMGYPDPLAARGSAPFAFCDNHIRLAHEAGLGEGDVARIDVVGEAIDSVATRFARLDAGTAMPRLAHVSPGESRLTC
jgi:uncharacterized protein (DUF362 family)